MNQPTHPQPLPGGEQTLVSPGKLHAIMPRIGIMTASGSCHRYGVPPSGGPDRLKPELQTGGSWRAPSASRACIGTMNQPNLESGADTVNCNKSWLAGVFLSVRRKNFVRNTFFTEPNRVLERSSNR